MTTPQESMQTRPPISAGSYRLSNLPAGIYTLSVEASGFTTAEVRNVEIVINQTGTSNVSLQIAKSSTSVEVTTSATTAIDTSTAQIQTTFEAKQLADLPTASGGQNNSGILNLLVTGARRDKRRRRRIWHGAIGWGSAANQQ